MHYCTLEDITKLIPEATVKHLTDEEKSGAVNQGRVDEAIAQADAEIDSYIGGRYAVPLSSVPGILKKLSVDIAIYNLYSRRVEKMPEVRAERYKNAIRQLEGISKGLVSLGIPPSEAEAQQSPAGETNKEADGNVFSRGKMEGL